MSQFQYGFIIKAPGYTPGEKNQVLESDAFKSNIIGIVNYFQEVLLKPPSNLKLTNY